MSCGFLWSKIRFTWDFTIFSPLFPVPNTRKLYIQRDSRPSAGHAHRPSRSAGIGDIRPPPPAADPSLPGTGMVVFRSQIQRKLDFKNDCSISLSCSIMFYLEGGSF